MKQNKAKKVNTIRKCSMCDNDVAIDGTGQIYCSIACQIAGDPIDDSRLQTKSKNR